MTEKTAAEIIVTAIEMGKRIASMEDQLAKARQIYPWELLKAVLTGELDPQNADHLALMQELVLGLTPGSAYFDLYHKSGASSYEDTMKRAAEAILKFYGKYKEGDPRVALYKFFLTVSPDEVYRVTITMSEDVPKIEKELLTP